MNPKNVRLKYKHSKCSKCGWLREFMFEKVCPFCHSKWIKK